MVVIMGKMFWMCKESKVVFFVIVMYVWIIMGFLKKYKEKDKDRDRERRREKECKYWDKDWECDRDLEKEKSLRWREEWSREKWGYGLEEDIVRVDKKKVKREDYDDFYEYVVEELVCDDFESSKL